MGGVSKRPYPVRMHEKFGLLYHVFENKWRRLGTVSDPENAFQRYHEIERTVLQPVIDAKAREREERKQAKAREREERPRLRRTLRETYLRLDAQDLARLVDFASALAEGRDVSVGKTDNGYYGFYGGGTPVR